MPCYCDPQFYKNDRIDNSYISFNSKNSFDEYCNDIREKCSRPLLEQLDRLTRILCFITRDFNIDEGTFSGNLTEQNSEFINWIKSHREFDLKVGNDPHNLTDKEIEEIKGDLFKFILAKNRFGIMVAIDDLSNTFKDDIDTQEFINKLAMSYKERRNKENE